MDGCEAAHTDPPDSQFLDKTDVCWISFENQWYRQTRTMRLSAPSVFVANLKCLRSQHQVGLNCMLCITLWPKNFMVSASKTVISCTCNECETVKRYKSVIPNRPIYLKLSCSKWTLRACSHRVLCTMVVAISMFVYSSIHVTAAFSKKPSLQDSPRHCGGWEYVEIQRNECKCSHTVVHHHVLKL